MSDQFFFVSPSLELPIPCYSKPTAHQSLLLLADDLFDFRNCGSHLALYSSEQEESTMEKVEAEDKSEEDDGPKPPHDLLEVLGRNSIPCTNSSCLTLAEEPEQPQQQSSQSGGQLRTSSIWLERSQKIETTRPMRKRPISYAAYSLSMKDPSRRPSYRKQGRKSVAKRGNHSTSCVIPPPVTPTCATLPAASLDPPQAASTHRNADVSLCSLTKMVFDIIKEQKSAGFKQVYEILLGKVTSLTSRTLSSDSLRRRVYDIVNVLESSGLVKRGPKKTVRLVEQQELAAQKRAKLQAMRREVQDKRDALKLRCKEALALAENADSEDTEMVGYCKALAKKMGSRAKLRFW